MTWLLETSCNVLKIICGCVYIPVRLLQRDGCQILRAELEQAILSRFQPSLSQPILLLTQALVQVR